MVGGTVAKLGAKPSFSRAGPLGASNYGPRRALPASLRFFLHVRQASVHLRGLCAERVSAQLILSSRVAVANRDREGVLTPYL